MSRFFYTLSMLLFSVSMGLSSFVHPAYAEAPQVTSQAPGYYRIQLGTFEITALYDGPIKLNAKMLYHIKKAKLDHLLGQAFVGNPKVVTSVNAYLVNTGTHLVLIDTGAAKLFGPTLGHVPENLKAAGYDPAQVDTVLITHMHGDHIGGLNDAAGKPVYPNATIHVAKAESDFWLSRANADKAPKEMKPFFQMAQNTAKQYVASGKWKTFSTENEIVPGIKAIDLKGHTPGHTGYLIESQGKKLLIWGDVVHFSSIQFARPGVSIGFDVDQKQAIATRKMIFKKAAAEKLLVAGMHMPFPGIGHVRSAGKHAYRWIPLNFGQLAPGNTAKP